MSNNYDSIQKKRLLRHQQLIVKHIIKKCDLVNANGDKKEINRKYFDSKEFIDAIQYDLLIIKQIFKGNPNVRNARLKSYEFTVFKTIIKITGLYTLKYRHTTTSDRTKSISLYWLIPV